MKYPFPHSHGLRGLTSLLSGSTLLPKRTPKRLQKLMKNGENSSRMFQISSSPAWKAVITARSPEPQLNSSQSYQQNYHSMTHPLPKCIPNAHDHHVPSGLQKWSFSLGFPHFRIHVLFTWFLFSSDRCYTWHLTLSGLRSLLRLLSKGTHRDLGSCLAGAVLRKGHGSILETCDHLSLKMS